MKAKFTVTFESDLLPCRTHQGVINLTSPQGTIARAVKLAAKEFKGQRWRSLVAVIEKVKGEDDSNGIAES